MTINGASTINHSEIVNQQYTDTVVKAVERVNTGLKINSTADDSAAAIISISLGANSSALLQGIENANEGLGLISTTNNSLTKQEDILNLVKDRLELAKSVDSNTNDVIRTEIESLLTDFDDIASSTSYNNNYTLQRSSSDTTESLGINLTFSNETTITTDSIQANTQGLGLDNLKNLNSGELTYDNILTEITNVENALNTIETYKDDFAATQGQIQSSIENLTTVQSGNEAAKEYLTKADVSSEQAIIDQYRRLVDSSEYAIVQANTTQERVLQLLTDIPEYTPREETDNTTTTSEDKDTNTYNTSTDNSYTIDTNTNNSNTQNTSPSFTSSDDS